MNDQHLDEDQIIVSIVDEKDLPKKLKGHLEACPVCQERRGALMAQLEGMGHMAKELTPRPQSISLPEPKVSWGSYGQGTGSPAPKHQLARAEGILGIVIQMAGGCLGIGFACHHRGCVGSDVFWWPSGDCARACRTTGRGSALYRRHTGGTCSAGILPGYCRCFF